MKTIQIHPVPSFGTLAVRGRLCSGGHTPHPKPRGTADLERHQLSKRHQPVSFLHPLLWLGALTAVVPLWLHLRHERPTEVVRFSALRFLDDAPKPRRGSRKLRDPRLLLLRLLALLLAVAGFAWPYLHTTAPEVAVSRVHLLDATLSQSLDGGFEDDLEALHDALAISPENVQDAVVVLEHAPRIVAGFGDGKESALKRLGELRPTHQRGSYLEAFRLAASLAERSLGETRELRVYGDFQANQWSEHRASPPFLRGVDVELVGEPPAREMVNLALHEPRSRLVFLGDETFVDLTLDLIHQGVARSVEIAIEADGERVQGGEIDLPATTGTTASTTTVRARFPADPATWIRGTATLVDAEDDLPADDRAHFTIPPLREGRIAYLARSPYLRAVLAPEVMRGRFAATRLVPDAVDPEALLDDLPDVLLAEAGFLSSERVRALVLRLLANDRGVILLLDRVTPLVRGFLRDLGFEVLGRERTGAEQTFRYFNLHHPIFRPFAGGELGDLLAVRVRSHVRLRSQVARPLVFGHAGGALLVEGIETKGRLLLFTFGFSTGETNWPVTASFVPFLDLTLQYARGATPLQTSWTPGDLVALDLPRDPSEQKKMPRSALLRRHGETLERLSIDDKDSYLRIRLPDEPGFVEVVFPDGDGTPREDDRILLAIHPDRAESRLVFDPDPDALAAWTLPDDDVDEPSGAALAGATGGIEEGQLWWWLLAASFAFLLAESAALLGRREIP